MRNVRHLARAQLGQHSDRLLAHGRKAIAEPAELAVGERLELAPEGANMEAVELVAVPLLQRQQLRQCTCFAYVDSEMPRIERCRFWLQSIGRALGGSVIAASLSPERATLRPPAIVMV